MQITNKMKTKQDVIKIRGARVHNLKNINLNIPKNKLVVITGVSGSGKSSLAFDTLYAEGQRRYVESLSAYARQFLGVMQKPEVDKIEGISPAISIDQRKSSHNPRSTVGTMTEIYDYLRVLFAKVGVPHCPLCKRVVSCQTIDQIIKQVLTLPQREETLILGPVVRGRKGEHKTILQEIERGGFVRVRVNGTIQRIEESLTQNLDKNKKHNIEVVVDRLVIDGTLEKSRLADSLETGLKLGKGIVIINQKSNPPKADKNQNEKLKARKGEDLLFSERFTCEDCGISMPEIEPRIFSFNSPFGACPSCQGLGKKLEVVPELVMPNHNLSIAEGAIFPWARASHKIGRQGYFWHQLQELSRNCNFSLEAPVKSLPQNILNLILYGFEKKTLRLSGHSDSVFEGVIPALERKYWETDSDSTREEISQYMRERLCEVCQGKRLKRESLAVKLAGKGIDELVEMSIVKAQDFFRQVLLARQTALRKQGFQLVNQTKLPAISPENLDESQLKIAEPLIKEIMNRLGFLLDVGLDYLTLSRETATLSGGEEQRTRLATQIGSKLTGVLYILDEPSVGLHQRDQGKLIATLKKLRDLGNSVLVVEHDPQTIMASDWVIDIGPGAGKYGGRVMFQGMPSQLLCSKTLTGEYLSGRKKISGDPEKISKPESPISKQNFLTIKGAQENNLKNIDVKIPLGKFVCVTGVSGSGKSSLVNDILSKALYKKFYRSKEEPGKYKAISGIEFLDKAALVTQDPIGRTPRSNPATYTGAFNHIRDIFTKVKQARVRGYKTGRFSFNVKGGRCEACEGQGVKKIEMYFLPDVYVVCQECQGKRYNQETLEVEYKGKNISDVLNFTVEEALNFFSVFPALKTKLKTLQDVGLGYISLGQSAPSLSGGEAQRVKLATELSKQSSSKTMYILDEPTTGLHPDDIRKLLFVLKELVKKGNTILAIEHNLDFIKAADWIIDLGPEGGDRGGYIVAEGPAQQIVKSQNSYTGKYLKTVIKERLKL